MSIRTSAVIRHFSKLEDFRLNRKKRHLLVDIITIAIMAGLCGIDSFDGMAVFAKARLKWLKQFLQLPNGAPSHDTFNRVFARIKAEEFQKCFISWMNEIRDVTDGEVVAIDGKSLRRSFDRASAKSAIHMISAWATDNGVVLGQVKTDAKSNEITAIPSLLESLSLKGCLVTIDAMGCQRDIADKIVKAEADYTLALKGNQGTLHEDVRGIFENLKASGEGSTTKELIEEAKTSHGRTETRHYFVSSDIDTLQRVHNWPGLKSVGMVTCDVVKDGKTSTETRFYLNSYDGDAKKFANAVRKHWQVEALHWILDVSYSDDHSRARKEHAAENLLTIRRIAINLLRRDPEKRSIPSKQISCAHNEKYLLKTLKSRGF